MQRAMPKPDFPSVFCATFVLFALTACSPDPSEREPGLDHTAIAPQEAREFSEEDKRVASALSLSQGEAAMQAEGPYARALLCSHGIEVLAMRFGDGAGLSDHQREAMVQARAYFAQQLRAVGEDEGKTAREISADLEQTAQDNYNDGESIRTAASCLRRLQEGA